MIRDGSAEVVVAGATEAPVTPLTISAFARMGAMSGRNDDPVARLASVRRRPRRLRHRRRRGVLRARDTRTRRRHAAPPIYGEVLGYGRNADAHHITAPVPGGAGAAACMQLALDDAGLDSSDIGHVNAHGTSTPLNDATEAEAIRKVFADRQLPVTSTKGVTGHMIAGAGAAEAVIALLSLRDGVVPPTANLEQIGDDIGLDIVGGRTPTVSNASRCSRTRSGSAVTTPRSSWVSSSSPPRSERPRGADAGLRASQLGGRRLAPRARRTPGQLVQPRRRQAPGCHRHRGGRRRSGAPSASAPSSASRSSAASPAPAPTSSEGMASLHAWGRWPRP